MMTSSHINPILYGKTYYVEASDSSHPFNPIAIRPKVNLTTSSIEWEDTTPRGKYILFTKLKINGLDFSPAAAEIIPQKIEVLSTRNEKITLTLLSLEIFNSEVKDQVMGGANLSFQSDEDVQKFYFNQNFNAY